MGERMKIAFFCWESLYSEKVGGLASAATHLAEMLARRHEVHYFTRGKHDEEIGGVQYHYCRPEGQNIVDYCRDLSMRSLERFREFDRPPFHILHFHDWHFTEALHRLKNRRTVLSFHSSEYGRNGNSFGSSWIFGEISGKEWYAAYIARRVTAVSKTLADEVAWLYRIPDWKIDVVQNGIFPDLFSMPVDPRKVKKSYGIDASAPLVFFGGRLAYQKGPDLLLAAIPEVLKNRWDASFVFAGDGDMRRHLEKKGRRLPAHFLGYVPDQEFVRLLNASDIVVIPSRNEPFGLILTEAWSAQRCVVATDVGGLSENIENFVDGIKVHRNPESIAWGVNHVIDDPANLCSIGMRGRKKVEREFKWERIAEKMENVYRRVS
jgi:glycogen(starch) synthase